jgi:lipopolysaccharide export system protein LptC
LADGTQMRERDAAPAGLARGGAFRDADRHSRRVRLLKILVPGLAVLGSLAFVAYALFDPFRAKDIKVDVGALSVSGDKLTMEMPHLTGFNRREDAYNVTAKSASQHLTTPGLIDLTDLQAVISMTDKTTATLKASTGRFDSSAERLTLDQNVTVASTKGYSADLSSAVVDFKAGTVNSQQNVKVNLNGGVVNAGGLTVLGGGDVITFRNGVSTRFQKPAAEKRAKPVRPSQIDSQEPAK